jgi:hypothetical protein
MSIAKEGREFSKCGRCYPLATGQILRIANRFELSNVKLVSYQAERKNEA